MGERGNRATVSAGRPSGAALLRLGVVCGHPLASVATESKSTLLRIGCRDDTSPQNGSCRGTWSSCAGTSLEWRNLKFLCGNVSGMEEPEVPVRERLWNERATANSR